jgi:hypothetical protein
MRLARDVPEAKVALESGRLSLSNAAKVQSFRQAERKQGRRHVVSAGLHEKLQRLKGLLALSHPDASYAELLEVMADEMDDVRTPGSASRSDARY